MVSREQEAKMLEETRLLVDLFLKTQESDIDLEKRTGISSSTVGRRLTNKKRIIQVYGYKIGEEIYNQVMGIRKNNLQKGKKIGGQKSMLNNVYVKDENGKFSGSTKLRVDVIYDDELLQKHFLFHLALTFKAKPKTIADLFQIDEKKLLEDLIGVSMGGYNSLLNLIYHDNSDQELVKQNIISYYRELLYAISKKDNEEKIRLINMVSDEKASLVKKSLEDGTVNTASLTDEDVEVLFRYQIKYALSVTEVANTFGLDAKIYEMRISSLKALEEEKNALDSISDFPGGRK
ncbi:MAG: hypothetical protein IJN13_05650 [Bacilli bacterium]|nr:hypothetical protein [Bacilli bacterium]